MVTNLMYRLSAVVLLLLIASVGRAQFVADHNRTANYLVESMLLGGANVRVSEVQYTGNPLAIGEFLNQDGEAVLPSGILISTGLVETACGPNDAGASGDALGEPGDLQLTVLATERTFDAAVLEFDLIPAFDSLYFEYCFASEEYPEFVNKGKNDVFGFFLFGPEYPEGLNLATLSDGSPITINNINRDRHAEYYRPNNLYEDKTLQKREDAAGLLFRNMQFDGFTTQLIAQARVTAGQKYHLRIAIADSGDPMLDSGVFLRGRSFKSTNTVAAAARKVVAAQASEVTEKPQNSPQQTASRPPGLPPVLFAHNSAELDQNAKNTLKQAVAYLIGESDLHITLEGHTDNVGSPAYNQRLSEQRTQAVKRYLLSQNVSSAKISATSKGETEPSTANESESGRHQNRRVELFFHRESVSGEQR